MSYQPWYNPIQLEILPQHPGSQMPHKGFSMSPRNPPSALQGPSTPTLSHTITSPVHPPHPSALAHSSNGLLTSPPSTPSTLSISGANQLNVGSHTFVPRATKITIRKPDGTEVSLEDLTKSTSTPSAPALLSPQSSVLRQKANQVDHDSPELVERKVKALLNKLTMEKFASISDQIIAWANKSKNEKDGRTLVQVIRLVLETATDGVLYSETCARLCRKMMEQIGTDIQNDGIRNPEGKPITGGQLFRKYLLNRCQEDFERGWVAKEATAAAAATKALEDEAAKAANSKTKEGGTKEIVLYSDEYYAAQKAKRQGLGLIKFIGELFKLQMLTERNMHECVKKLLGNVDNPEEEEIGSLCMLLTTVGSMLDIQKARGHMDVYFSRMKELMKSPNVTPRLQYMLQVGHWCYLTTIFLTFISYRICSSSANVSGLHVMLLLPLLPLHKSTRM
jgi:MIF4G domain